VKPKTVKKEMIGRIVSLHTVSSVFFFALLPSMHPSQIDVDRFSASVSKVLKLMTLSFHQSSAWWAKFLYD